MDAFASPGEFACKQGCPRVTRGLEAYRTFLLSISL